LLAPGIKTPSYVSELLGSATAMYFLGGGAGGGVELKTVTFKNTIMLYSWSTRKMKAARLITNILIYTE
jgi:hypothetical protein